MSSLGAYILNTGSVFVAHRFSWLLHRLRALLNLLDIGASECPHDDLHVLRIPSVTASSPRYSRGFPTGDLIEFYFIVVQLPAMISNTSQSENLFGLRQLTAEVPHRKDLHSELIETYTKVPIQKYINLSKTACSNLSTR